MTADRELLELAAKAAGIEGVYDADMDAMQRPAKQTSYGPAHSYWNPLKDDGDALRLAVSTAQTVVVDPERKEASAIWYGGLLCSEPFKSKADAFPATRRAIVRAAAEIGKKVG